MNRLTPRSFLAPLSYQLVASERLSSIACWGCRAILDLHQPDPNQPDRFLGTCTGCGRWYRVAPTTDGPGLVVLELPEAIVPPLDGKA